MERKAGTLGLGRKFGYGLGDFGLNLHWQGMALFLTFFQTEIMGLSPVWAGVTFFVAVLWDGIADPIMGLIADRTRGRWGSFRPYLLFGALPLAASSALAFTAPGLVGAAAVSYALGTHMLLRTAYTVVAIPYSSLSARMTSDADERTSLTGWRMLFAFGGGAAVSWMMPWLAREFAGGDAARGYAIAASIIGALSAVAFVACFLMVREQPVAAARLQRDVRVWDDLKGFLALARRGGPTVQLYLCILISQIMVPLQARNYLYFFKYGIGDMERAQQAMALFGIINVACVPLWVWLIRRTEKRTGFMVGGTLFAIGSLGFALMPEWGYWSAFLPLALACAGHTAYAVCIWAMLPDTVDWSEWRFRRRDEGKIFGLAAFLQKAALGISGLLMAAVFHGFEVTKAGGGGSEMGLRVVMGVIPLAGILAAMFIMRDYRLDVRRHGRIVERLGNR
ncbi:MFS transporter [Niveispirillum sp. KHB5.9]|uniref:MFS transporter n=1 Tax=Niveispirillum sp. KHB5.9 TaxID=3400269 RepID=UPI003A87851F